jgi:hypothetical protein
MANLFDTPRITLNRAQHHIRDLETRINAFVREKPWTYLIDNESTPGQELHKIKFTQRLPEVLPCIVFDAVSNLRATLDQCGYASAVASGKANPKQTAFPFGDDLTGLDNNIIRRKVCNDLPPEIVSLFRTLKPYKGGNDSLWALNKLCNTQKHCALVPTQIGKASAFFTGRFTSVGGSTIDIVDPGGNLGWDPEKSEIIVFIGGGGAWATAKSDIAANVAITVAIEGIETQSGKPVVAALDAMRCIVEGILMATKTECRRLGFKID